MKSERLKRLAFVTKGARQFFGMHIDNYFGDSYDIVKQSFIRWLTDFGPWSVHPMFTESTEATKAAAFAKFLSAKLLSDIVLTTNTNRPTYFNCALTCGNLLLDPNTGLRIDAVGGRRAPEFLFASDLVPLVRARPKFLTIVFDQSYSRGSARTSLSKKLTDLSDLGISAIAYESHACFLLVGQDSALIASAHKHLLVKSGLPATRFVSSFEFH